MGLGILLSVWASPAAAQSDRWQVHAAQAVAYVQAEGGQLHIWLLAACRGGAIELSVQVKYPENRTATPTQIQGFNRLLDAAPDRDGIHGILAVLKGGSMDQIIRLHPGRTNGDRWLAARLEGREPAAFIAGDRYMAQIGQVTFYFSGAGSARAIRQIGCDADGAVTPDRGGPGSVPTVYGSVPDFAPGTLLDFDEVERRYPLEATGWRSTGGWIYGENDGRGVQIFTAPGGRHQRYFNYVLTARTGNGAHRTGRVVDRIDLILRVGEEMGTECGPPNSAGIDGVVVSVVPARGRVVRGIGIRNGRLVEEQWTMSNPGDCFVD